MQEMSESTTATIDQATPLLEVRGINKSFGPVHVLHDVDFRVYPGKITALIGDNGAGKSTLVKCLAGIYSTDSGTIHFDGAEVTIHTPKDAFGLGIKVVYQDLALCDNLDIVENMFLGREIVRRGTLDEHAMELAARQTLASLSVRTVKSVRQLVASLSGGQRQTVAIAKAVLGNSRIVILDEPTAALGVAQTAQVLDLVKRLADNGVGVVIDQPQHERRARGVRPRVRHVPRAHRRRHPARRERHPGDPGRADHVRPLRSARTRARGGGSMTTTDDSGRADR